MEFDLDDDSIKEGLSIRRALSGPSNTIEMAFRALRNENFPEITSTYIQKPAKRVLSKKVYLEEELGKGYWEFVYLSDDLYMLISKCMLKDSRVESLPGEGFLEFHFKLNGQLDMISEEKDLFSVYGPSVLIWGQSKGVDFREIITGGIAEHSVTLYVRKTLLTEKLGLLPSELPMILQNFTKGNSFDILHEQVPMQPQMIMALREIFNSPYVGSLRLVHQETKAYDLLCAIIWTLQQKNDSDMFQIKVSEKDLAKIKDAGDYMTTHFNMPPTINELARMVGLNQTKLKAGFKQAFGATIFDFCQRQRMNKAAELLKDTELSLNEIAFQVGYQHQSTFTTAFKRYYGILPKSIRH